MLYEVITVNGSKGIFDNLPTDLYGLSQNVPCKNTISVSYVTSV